LDKYYYSGGDVVRENDIEILRYELNRLISEGASYDVIYKLSTDLDILINEYYKKKERSA